MVDDRNLTTHTYHEGLAAGIYEKLVGYAELMDFCLRNCLKIPTRLSAV
jgi:hypothetical protein